jgi:glycosyltransferase involved in cell wall biosynthesis
MNSTKIAHLTSVHPRHDTRIFLKECKSLERAGYEVVLVVADGNGKECLDGVTILDAGASSNRIDRVFRTTSRVYAIAKAVDADIYHLHDPELLPVALRLKHLGKVVLFDSHEDVPKQLLSKSYLNSLVGWLLSKVVAGFEAWVCKRLDGVIAATPHIGSKFRKISANTVEINNFPILGELSLGEINWAKKKNYVSYIGGISFIRGICEVVDAMAIVKNRTHLQLGGGFSQKSVSDRVQNTPGWVAVEDLGFLDRKQVLATLASSFAGLVTFHPLPNHIDAQPNKMFEYMSAGIPVIASNFPLWKEIVEDNNCGLCVNPMEPVMIAQAIDYLFENPVEAERMGRNGQKLVQDRYNWEIEEAKLLGYYKKLIR